MSDADRITLRLPRDVARARLKALEELLFEVETSPILAAALRGTHGDKTREEAQGIPPLLHDVEQLREALHAALYCEAGE